MNELIHKIYFEKDFIIESIKKVDDLMLVSVFIGGWRNYRCGYVGVPKGHRLYGKDYREYILTNIEVHGGLTSSSNDLNLLAGTKDYWYFGFDCGHIMDAPDIKSAVKYGVFCADMNSKMEMLIKSFKDIPSIHGEIRTKEYVLDEISKLAKQLK